MRDIHYIDGRVAMKVMTVSDMRKRLKGLPPNMPILCEWEGQLMPIVPVDERERHFVDDKGKPVLMVILDANGY